METEETRRYYLPLATGGGNNAYSTVKLPLGLRVALSSDRDLRRLFWLLRRAQIRAEHRDALVRIESRARAKLFGEWSQPGERETIRVLFNLYKGTNVRIRA